MIRIAWSKQNKIKKCIRNCALGNKITELYLLSILLPFRETYFPKQPKGKCASLFYFFFLCFCDDISVVGFYFFFLVYTSVSAQLEDIICILSLLLTL